MQIKLLFVFLIPNKSKKLFFFKFNKIYIKIFKKTKKLC
jgi:hypothetical protein